MKTDFRLKVQAFLDGQLSEREARFVEQRLAFDTEASDIYQELLWAKTMLAGNEPQAPFPESGEFYWSKIQKAIWQEERLAANHHARSAVPWFSWKKWLAPMSALGLAFLICLGIFKFYDLNSVVMPSRFLAQIESPSEDMGAFSFRSQSENVFVIWLYERSGDPRPEVNLVNDMVIQ